MNLNGPITDHASEAACLGACLMSSRNAEILSTEHGLRPEHFWSVQNQRTFAVMLDLATQGIDIDVITVAGRLADDPTSREYEPPSGWHSWIDHLTGGVPSLGAAPEYARRVIAAWQWNGKLRGHHAALVAIESRDEAALLEAEKLTEQLVADGPGRHLTNPMDLAEHLAVWLDRPKEPGMPMPWPEVEKILRLRRGHTTVISGWSNIGKSQVASQLAAHIGQKGGHAVQWTNEMGVEELAIRQVTRDTAVNFNDIMDGRLGPRDAKKVAEALPRMPFGIVAAHAWPADQIARHIRQVKPDLAVVDHFHALPNIGNTEGADHAVQTLVTSAALADCHLLLVAQLNQTRNVNAARPAPVLRDLRSTGQMYALPNNVLFVHRDDEEDAAGHFKAGASGHLDVAKQRGGELGVVQVHFNDRRLTFLEETAVYA